MSNQSTALEISFKDIKVNPKFNVRTNIDPTEIENLSKSIHSKGLLESLVVKRNGSGFELLAGFKRHLAISTLIQEGKWKGETVPCTVVASESIQDDKLTNLAENINRSSIGKKDMCRALDELEGEKGYKPAHIVKTTGIHQSELSACLSVWRKLEPSIKKEWLAAPEDTFNFSDLIKLSRMEHAKQLEVWAEMRGDKDDTGEETGDDDDKEKDAKDVVKKPGIRAIKEKLDLLMFETTGEGEDLKKEKREVGPEDAGKIQALKWCLGIIKNLRREKE
jgi:ParB-like chromosome segregation protein Spo0J